jgi:hypothetical protein
MSVSNRFLTLLKRIEPTQSELEHYASHRYTVTTRLKTVFPAKEVELVGSHSRGAAVHGLSDLDLMLRLPRSEATWDGRLMNSDTVLTSVRRELEARYRGETGIRKDGQAIVIGFGGGNYSVDVVPAVWEGMVEVGHGIGKRPLLSIPDGQNGWLATSPQAHAAFIAGADQRSGGKLKYTVQLLKYWRACRAPAVPIESFHIELLLAHERVCEVGKGYAESLRDAFRLLNRRECRALQDPLGVSGLVRAAGTDSKRTNSCTAVSGALEHAEKALSYETSGPVQKAYDQWDIVFNGNFPKS